MSRTLTNMTVVLVMILFSVGCHKPEEPNNQGNNNEENDSIIDLSGSYQGHSFVDLGLPSGTLWATCNIGADSSGSFGDYFAWGETTPKNLYDWKSYKYGNYERFELTKYCTDSVYGLNGFVDNLTVLELADDAVTANWGEGWRMPTKEEYEELNENTTFVWITQNGVDGRLLTGPNGNSVFFPATGFCLDGEVICPGLGIYWSSTLHSGCTERGWSLHFDFENCHVCGTYERCRGQMVRAVRAMR